MALTDQQYYSDSANWGDNQFVLLKDIRALELELPDDLQLELPKDFVRLVRLSWVEDRGRLHPMMMDTETTIAKAYLQDDSYNIIFDNDGAATEGTSVIDTKLSQVQSVDNDTFTNLDY